MAIHTRAQEDCARALEILHSTSLSFAEEEKKGTDGENALNARVKTLERE